MPITNSSQKWGVGEQVKVGFLKLTITALETTPGDYKPDIYHLTDDKDRHYTFTPHYGLARV